VRRDAAGLPGPGLGLPGGARTLRGPRVRSPPETRSPPFPLPPREPVGKKHEFLSKAAGETQRPGRKAVRAAVRKTAVREEGVDMVRLLPAETVLTPDGRPERRLGFPRRPPGGTTTPPRHPVSLFTRGRAAPMVPAQRRAGGTGWGEWADGSSPSLLSPSLFSRVLLFVFFFLSSSVANCFSAPGPTCK